jgi:phage baseplate assembly protein W
MALYKGFSTYRRTRKFKVADEDLIKQDLFNHFNIRKGEKLMNPGFGTIIWGLLFEPLTDDTKQLIIDDVTAICNYDPRVTLDSMTLGTYDYGINLQLNIRYTNSDQTDVLNMQFDNRNTTTATY